MLSSMMFQYDPGSSLFHRIDPLSKFIWLASVSALCLATAHPWVQLALLGGLVGCGRWGAGLRFGSMWRGLRLPFFFSLPYFVLQLLFVPGETVLWSIGSLQLTEEALSFAFALTLRWQSLVLSSLLFVTSTDPRDLVLALTQQARVPYRFAFGISIALRFLPILQQEATIIRDAHRLRGLGRPAEWRAKLAAQRRYALAVFIAAVRRIETISTVMELKGFGARAERTYRRTIRFTRSGRWLAVGSVGVACVGCTLLWL